MRIMHISRASVMICQFLIPLIKMQKEKGHYVCVCGSEDPDAQKLKDSGIDVFTHQLRRSLNPLSIIRAIFRIKRILIEHKIDVVICHTPLGAGVGRIAAKFAKTKNVVYFVHGYTCAPGQNKFKWLTFFCIEKILGMFTDAALVMNDYDEKLCKKHHMVKDMSKVFRVPGIGVDLKKFNSEASEDTHQQVKDELGILEDKKIILCVAYLIPEKGIFIFLEAAKKICFARADICFLIAGKGPCMQKLEERCAKYGLKNSFKILGWRNDIHRLMRASDIFALPSYYWEGVPVSILEAMACAKPVVVTMNRGCVDIVINNETGFLVPIKQAAPFSEKLLILLDNEQLRTQMGQAGRRRVEQYFGLDYCTESIVDALERGFQKVRDDDT